MSTTFHIPLNNVSTTVGTAYTHGSHSLVLQSGTDSQFGSTFVSVPAAILRAIGGYWEAFVGWGHEDIEMALRLGRAGCTLAVRNDLARIFHEFLSRSTEVLVSLAVGRQLCPNIHPA